MASTQNEPNKSDAANPAIEFTRLLAYAMLIVGFVWICFRQFEIRPITRAVMVAQADMMLGGGIVLDMAVRRKRVSQ